MTDSYRPGVLITSFPGLIKYQGEVLILYGEPIPWEVFIRLPLKAVMTALSDRELYHARKPHAPRRIPHS